MPEAHEIALEAYGVRLSVSASSPELLARIERILPPGWRPHDAADVTQHFVVTAQDDGSYRVAFHGASLSGSSDIDVAVEVLNSRLRQYVAYAAPSLIFIHAGVVAHDGRAILIPGASFSGKTTLVAELVRAGATYYSDEFAVLDENGLAHPYAKPLSIRAEGATSQSNHDVEALGGSAGDEPVPVGLVVVTSYRREARWEPRRCSAGEGVLSLLEHTIPAQERPAASLTAVSRAVNGATVLEGERGDASVLPEELLGSVAI